MLQPSAFDKKVKICPESEKVWENKALPKNWTGKKGDQGILFHSDVSGTLGIWLLRGHGFELVATWNHF